MNPAVPPGESAGIMTPVEREARWALSVRFAIEEMPPQLLVTACLEVNEVRFDGEGIRVLYESTDYPHVRLAAASPP